MSPHKVIIAHKKGRGGEAVEVLVDEVDYERFKNYRWRVDKGGYVNRKYRGKNIWMHREIISPAPGLQVDHINNNPQDNRRCNLRIVTPADNARNRSKRVGSTSQFKGVTFHKQTGKWQAALKRDRKTIYLGLFSSEEEAARAYDTEAAKNGPYTHLNFPVTAEGGAA